MTYAGGPDTCCLCGQSIKGGRCRHPWGSSFENWPRDLLAEVHAAIGPGWDYQQRHKPG